MIRLGLTGGIGAGKSTVAKTFVERGAYIIDADKIAREVVEPGSPGLAGLVEAFGSDILTEDGSLDRPALAAKAFVDDESRGRLNAVTHPLIGARTQELLDAAPADAIVVQDIPLLVENHTAPFFHLVVIVFADADVRLHRLTTMRGVGEADARARIAAQATDEQRRAVADVWLDNSGEPEALAVAAARVWDERLVPLEANVRARRVAEPVPELLAAEPNPDGPSARLVNRLWALSGERATAVDVTDAASVELRITARDADAAAELTDRLADGGFAPTGPGVYGSCDPGRPATVRVATN
ncbi:dephospho-CoA kinase [Gordonia sp. zg691]|uniref:Dephospho-CoA kinase n=1 Tax=Gordonia jinghuaiqii TaxID=2758710 RepID=A0A7D7LZU2_9ACTN|nr:dephospho-CoA kinase [Gordonia jinghuaiqii]MBD0860238.1 dephospho-CoA kinase [Gordonia jinghuaiqii]MCR5977404.1 dephospho-CoA kinase [Gordonia jinghuaiqii]QMT03919.1 dephospho-CoA kinase [Gordonia jinghuaiqii]